MYEVELYSDGAYSRSRNVGAYAYLIHYFQKPKLAEQEIEVHTFEFSGKIENTTSNRMELLSVIEGLNKLKRPCTIKVISDSTYVVDTINKWITSFIKDPTRANHDMMVDLYQAIKKHKKVVAQWVRGHSGNQFNDRVNELAQRAAGTWKGK